MSINTIGAFGSSYTAKNSATRATQKEETAQEAAAQAAPVEDGFSAKTLTESVTYSKPGKPSVEQLRSMEQTRTESFTRMLKSMVVKQGQKSNLTLFGVSFYVSPEDSAAAAKTLEPGGEYSVDAVSGRILEMAKALAGSDDSKLSLLRDAVEKGFKAAGVDLGGKLPSICNDTYDAVMKGFDEWEQAVNAAD